MDKMTNGTRIAINTSGTSVYFRPGILVGGTITHDCSTLRSIGYFLEPLLCVAPFTKSPVKLVLRGITNGNTDMSVDAIRTTSLPLLRCFGLEDGVTMKIAKRGAPPLGGGEVNITIPVMARAKPVQIVDLGKIRRVRGIAYAAAVATTAAAAVAAPVIAV